MSRTLRIGCGAGFSGDRLEPSLILASKGQIQYLVLECLAERTIGLAQKRKLADPAKGYDPLLERRIHMLLPTLVSNKVKLITNMGAANPIAAAEKIIEIATKLGLKSKVAAVTGDDVLGVLDTNVAAIETGKPLKESGNIVSANAYLGFEGILEALRANADIIVTGRVADPSLFVAPMIHEFKWSETNYDLIGKATVLGHLMECAGQVTGGYFADPGKKDVPDLANLGHPILIVDQDGKGIITKVKGTGGVVDLRTVKEQLLYEVVDPHQYFTPDVVADFTSVRLTHIGEDEVSVSGGTGQIRPATLKVSVGYQAYYLGEGEITYGGPHALERGKLAEEIISERLKNKFPELRIDLIGHTSVHGGQLSKDHAPYEVRLRASARCSSLADAQIVGEEVEALYTNGPAGGGGVRKNASEVIGIVSTLVDRSKVNHKVILKES